MNDKEFHKIKLGEIRKGNLLILDKLKKDNPLTLNFIVQSVTRKMGINPQVLSQNTRQKDIVRTRQMIYNIAYNNLDISYKQLGKEIGNKKHATVLHSVKVIKNEVDTNKYFRELFNEIENEILNER